jgi:hypothetical protein
MRAETWYQLNRAIAPGPAELFGGEVVARLAAHRPLAGVALPPAAGRGIGQIGDKGEDTSAP